MSGGSVWARAADMWAPALSPYYRKPVQWVTDRLHEHLWSKQRLILESVRDNRKTAVPSCHGSGKSHMASRLVGWWLDAHPSGEAFVVTTAPSDAQVKAILWRYVSRVCAKLVPKLGRVTLNAQWKINDQLVAYGRKPADYDENAFQGIHDLYVLVIIDEAGGVPQSLWTQVDTLLTNDDARVLAIGNPDDPTSEFAAVCAGAPDGGGMSAQGWNVIPISAFDTPNFTGEPIPDLLRRYLVNETWVEERRRKWGVDSPLYTAKVLGRFPTDKADGIIPWSFIRNCQGEAASMRVGPLLVPVELGVDVAGSNGGDWTVVRERRGMHAGRVWRVRSSDPGKVLDKILLAIHETGASSVKVDSIGIGWGIVGDLRARGLRGEHKAAIHGVNVAVAAEQPKRFKNLRAEMWWEIGREFSRDGVWDLSALADDEDDETAAQLAAPVYFEKQGRIQVEAKDEIRKRIDGSTDDADALLLAFYVPPVSDPVQQDYQPQNDTRLRGRR